MAFNRNHARPLCTDAEYKLFTASLADEIGALTPASQRVSYMRVRVVRAGVQLVGIVLWH